MEEIGVPVDLYIYDLTKGMARLMSSMFLGHQVDGIWHTSIVAYGREYFFGSGGIESCNPGGTVLGPPGKIEKLGDTFVPYQIFLDYILGLGDSSFRGSEYNLLKHNCNNFSDDLANFLCGVGIPKNILELPEEILNTPFGQSLRPLIESLSTGNLVNGVRNSRQESPEYLQLNTQIDEARLQSLALEEKRLSISEKIARKERKKEKKRKKQQKEQEKLNNNSSSDYSDISNSGYTNNSPPPKQKMADAAAAELNGDSMVENFAEENAVGPVRVRSDKLPSDRVLEMEAEEKQEDEERKKNREPPIVFKDFMEASLSFDKLAEALDAPSLSQPDQQSLQELHTYLVQGEGSWALGDNFLTFIGRLLSDTSLQIAAREAVLNTLACAALRDDVILLLHQDRREHILMNYAYSIDRIDLSEQRALALFICNMFEHLSSSEWLLYISEWSHNNQQISNIRVTTKVAVHSLLSDDENLKDIGSAIIHNLACKEVFDDVAVELAMAVLQHLSSAPSEEHLYRCMKALLKFCQVSGQDVPQFIQMIGPNPSTFKGTSPRVDELIDAISKKLR